MIANGTHDFSADGIRTRHQSGYQQTRDMLARAPWMAPVDPMLGAIVHSTNANPES